MSDIFEFHDGREVRRLGLLEQPVESLKYAWPVFGESDGTPPLVQREQWQSTGMKSMVKEIKNQQNVGQCASAATAQCLEIARNLAGLEWHGLSAGDLYRRVCIGGRDNGSLPEDNLRELLTNGIAPVSEVPYMEWQRELPSPSRKMFRGLEAWRCPTAVHIASAITHGFPVVAGYFHHNNDNLDGMGWMRSPSGGRGGHAVVFVDLKFDGRDVGFEFANSWTRQWGRDGYGILPEERVAYGVRSFQAWALRATVQESGSLPPLKG